MTQHARILGEADAASVETFLSPHTPFAYFMISNLRRGGLTYQGKPYQADFFGAFRAGQLIGVLTHSWMGSVQIFAPDPTAVPCLAEAWRAHLLQQPREIVCFLGPAASVQALYDASGIAVTDLRPREGDEKLMTLALADMRMPALLSREGVIFRPAGAGDRDQLIPWRHDYYVEAIGDLAGPETLEKAADEITRRMAEGDLFVLEDHGQLVSFCGAGGFLSDWKVVGPVWTPPEKRGQGYGRAVTAGALASLRDKGATHAVLFTDTPPAERAYRAIGFTRIGDWRLEFLRLPVNML